MDFGLSLSFAFIFHTNALRNKGIVKMWGFFDQCYFCMVPSGIASFLNSCGIKLECNSTRINLTELVSTSTLYDQYDRPSL